MPRPRKSSATLARAATPRPSRSSIRNSKPPVAAHPWIGGGGKTSTWASLTLSATASRKLGNQRPGPQIGGFSLFPGLENNVNGAVVGLVHLCDRAVTVKPDRVGHTRLVQDGLLDGSMALVVGSLVVPSGVCTVTIRYPWSSIGIKIWGVA